MSGTFFTLRPYARTDEAAAIELWRRTWQLAYPALDFSARVKWWRERWRNELVPSTVITVAEHDGALIGFVTGLGVAAWISRANFHASVTPRLSVLPIVLTGSILLAFVSALIPIGILRRVQPATILRGE